MFSIVPKQLLFAKPNGEGREVSEYLGPLAISHMVVRVIFVIGFVVGPDARNAKLTDLVRTLDRVLATLLREFL